MCHVFSPSCAVLSVILRDEYLTSAVRTKEGDKAGSNQPPARDPVQFKLELTPNYLISYLENTGSRSTRYVSMPHPNESSILPKFLEKSDPEVARPAFSTWPVQKTQPKAFEVCASIQFHQSAYRDQTNIPVRGRVVVLSCQRSRYAWHMTQLTFSSNFYWNFFLKFCILEQIIATVLFICISSINNKRSLLRFQSTTAPTNRGWSACAGTLNLWLKES